jgi:histidinol-phosphatase
MAQSLVADLELALELGRLASHTALGLFRRNVVAREKPDGSLVTNGDEAVERQLLEVLGRERPEDAVLSEESGAIAPVRGPSVSGAARRWILDPIDGTSSFAAGRETWGTHVALEVGGEVVVGVITRPVRGEWFWAMRGGGAYRAALGARQPAERLRVSDAADADRARLVAWAKRDHALVIALEEQRRWIEPTLDAMLDLASGRIDALIDLLGFAWDIAPAVVLVEEAGGKFSDSDGGRRLDRFGGWFSNGKLDGLLQRFGAL